jgi:soluble lytic murein transglycosylase-like protein
MITLGLNSNSCFVLPPPLQAEKRENILRRFCFRLVLTILTAGALSAAGPDRPQRITSVVRSDLRTGKLVRSMVVSPKAVAERRIAETIVVPHVVSAAAPEPALTGPASPPAGIDEAVQRIAAEHSLSPQLIHSVIKVESNYDPHAVSSKGAFGLMQLIPATARRFGVTDVFNPIQNIQGGVKYLRYLLDLFDGSYPLALAAYNAGEAAVARYGGIPPYAETQNYVILVRRQWEQAKRSAAARLATAPAPVVEAEAGGPAHIVEEVQADGSVRYVSR